MTVISARRRVWEMEQQVLQYRQAFGALMCAPQTPAVEAFDEYE